MSERRRPKRIGKMRILEVIRIGREGEAEDKEGRAGDNDLGSGEHGL